MLAFVPGYLYFSKAADYITPGNPNGLAYHNYEWVAYDDDYWGRILKDSLKQLYQSPITLSVVVPVTPIPLVLGVGPAGSITYIPSSATLCGALGLGVSAGRDVSLSVPIFGGGDWPKNAVDISSGWSISAGITGPAGVGVQAAWSPSNGINGGTMSAAAGIPGIGGSVTYAYCSSLKP